MFIFVYADKKSSMRVPDDLAETAGYPNVRILHQRMSVAWGYFSQIHCSVRMLSLAVKDIRSYDYVLLLSGQELPLVNYSLIEECLRRNYGAEFIEAKKLTNENWRGNGGFDRVNKYHIHYDPHENICGKFRYKVFSASFSAAKNNFRMERRFFRDMMLYGGSNWVTITRDCASYIVEFLKKNPSYLRSFHFTRSGDEIFFQTIVTNSTFNTNAANAYLWFIDGESGLESPRILRGVDYARPRGSGKLFARKFDAAADKAIILPVLEAVGSP